MSIKRYIIASFKNKFSLVKKGGLWLRGTYKISKWSLFCFKDKEELPQKVFPVTALSIQCPAGHFSEKADIDT